ncbi:hypothetical protein GWI33_012906 [Rhynchophorus ferrugineus]|uniref:Uncharacterized protein n=1 Tax=Rhynchophorus ferrugineus TaxID=354439 RepID=A0A834IHZ9_RHYFE|nr:hypothetical protein GWI33_012906 [Rhynchophorus ferrugineus]
MDQRVSGLDSDGDCWSATLNDCQVCGIVKRHHIDSVLERGTERFFDLKWKILAILRRVYDNKFDGEMGGGDLRPPSRFLNMQQQLRE